MWLGSSFVQKGYFQSMPDGIVHEPADLSGRDGKGLHIPRHPMLEGIPFPRIISLGTYRCRREVMLPEIPAAEHQINDPCRFLPVSCFIERELFLGQTYIIHRHASEEFPPMLQAQVTEVLRQLLLIQFGGMDMEITCPFARKCFKKW